MIVTDPMQLDVTTLTLAGAFVAFAGSLFAAVHWWQNRAAQAAFWWALASLAMAIGVALLAFSPVLPRHIASIGAFILDGSAALTWASAFTFNRRQLRPFPILACIVGWFALILIMGVIDGDHLAPSFGVGTTGIVYFAAAFEFIRGRKEVLRGRWPLVGLLALEGAALLLTAVQFASSTLPTAVPPLGWFGAIHFVELIYALGATVSLITMLKERTEAKHKAAALTDPLTGLSNRRAFIEAAERSLSRSRVDGLPVTLLAFDLDKFKTVNDTFGHPVGDQVLRIFGEVLGRVSRPHDIVGRIGGEEFVAFLFNCDVGEALAVAGRIRLSFQEDARYTSGLHVGATVSVGIASATSDGSLESLMAAADDALYRAKALGRNRVAVGNTSYPDADGSKVVRIA